MREAKLGFSDLTGCVYIIIGDNKYDVTKDFEIIAKAKESLKEPNKKQKTK